MQAVRDKVKRENPFGGRSGINRTTTKGQKKKRRRLRFVMVNSCKERPERGIRLQPDKKRREMSFWGGPNGAGKTRPTWL